MNNKDIPAMPISVDWLVKYADIVADAQLDELDKVKQ